ncbi:MAG TPA: hypothetical protein VN328_02355 [Thermodesulfovibrionales bacterium]|nr:hypothetical protein [Thermodesulfovibrionales bacterium]
MDIFAARLILAGLFLSVLNGFLFSFINKFTFDDAQKVIRRALKEKIPYESVRAIWINETSNHIDILIKRKGILKYPLVNGLELQEKSKLMEELAKRFPPQIMKERKIANLKIILGYGFAILAIYSIALFYLYHKYPILFTIPRVQSIIISKSPSLPAKQHTIEGHTFSLPSSFAFVNKEKEDMKFEDAANKIKVTVTGRLFKYEPVADSFMGIGDSYDFLRMGVKARFGFIPLLSRIVFRDSLIYQFDEGSIKGLLIQRKDKQKELAHIVMVDKKKSKELNFYLSSTERIDKETLTEILSILVTP